MNQLEHATGRRTQWMRFLSILTVAAILFAFLLVRGFRHLTSQHYRPRGHTDTTFDISPDGSRIVFNTVGEGGRDLYLLDLSTFEVTRVAATAEYEVAPKFSPDGKAVVYAAGRPGDRADHLFLRSVDGTNVKQITAEDANDCTPAFSPDGSWIVFARDRNYNWGGLAANWSGGGAICVIRPDGSGFRRLTSEQAVAWDPHFSRDGQTILFWGGTNTPSKFAVPLDGTQPPKEVLSGQGYAAVYSPDEQHIAFAKGQYSPDFEIFLADSDGTNPRQLTDSHEGCFHPVFTPDGQHVLYFVQSWPTGPTGVPKYSLWIVSVETRMARRVADYDLFDDPLHWRP